MSAAALESSSSSSLAALAAIPRRIGSRSAPEPRATARVGNEPPRPPLQRNKRGRVSSTPLSFEARLHQRHVNAAARLLAQVRPEDRDHESADEDAVEDEGLGAQVVRSTVREATDISGIFTSPAFFASLARHSRLRPDLVATDLGIDEYAIRVQLAEYAKAASHPRAKRRSVGRRIGIEAHTAAREVSATFQEREEAWAEELLAEDRAHMERSTGLRKGLIRLVQANQPAEHEQAGDDRPADTGEGDAIARLLRLGSNADAFDLAQHRPDTNNPAPCATTAPPSPSSASRLSQLDPEQELKPKRAAFKAREAEEEKAFKELSSIPRHVRSEDERSLLAALRTRLRSRKRKRDEADTKRREMPDGAMAANLATRPAILLVTDDNVQDTAPQPGPPTKRRRTRAEKQAADERRLAELKAVGRKNMSSEQIAEYESLLKRREGRERMRRNKAAREQSAQPAATRREPGRDEDELDSYNQGSDSGDVAVGDDLDGVNDATMSSKVMSQRQRSPATVKEEKPDESLPAQEEELFNVQYFRGMPQNPEFPSLLKKHLCSFLNPLIHRSIIYAEALAPVLAVSEQRKRARNATGSQDSTMRRKRGRPRKADGQSERGGRADGGRCWDTGHEYMAPDGEAWWDDPEYMPIESSFGGAVDTTKKGVGVTMGNVHMALEAPTCQSFDDMLSGGVHGDVLQPEMMEELKELSHAHDLLELDDSEDEVDDSDSDFDEDMEDLESEEGDGLAGNTGSAHDSDPLSDDNGLNDIPDNVHWRRYVAEAELDAKLDAIDSAFDSLAERELDSLFSNADAILGSSIKKARQKRQSADCEAQEGQEGKNVGPAGDARQPIKDWDNVFKGKRARLTGDPKVDKLLKEYYKLRDRTFHDE